MNKSILFALVLSAFMVMPVFADVAPGHDYTTVSLVSADDLIAAPATVEGSESVTANSSNTKTELATYIYRPKTGIGVINASGMTGLNCMKSNPRLLLFEVGGHKYI